MEESVNWLFVLFHIACAYVVYGLKKGEIVARCRATKAKFTRNEEMICIRWLLLVMLVSCVTILGPLAILGIVLIPMRELRWAWNTPPDLVPKSDDGAQHPPSGPVAS